MLSVEKLSYIANTLWAVIKGRFAVHSIFFGVSLFATYFAYDAIPFSAFDTTLGLLQNISLAMFTVAGIWIAILYPQAIAAYTDSEKVVLIPSTSSKRIESLVLIILTSALVMAAILVLEIFYVILSANVDNHAMRSLAKFLGMTAIFYLSLIQLRAIWVIIYTNASFVNELYEKENEKRAYDNL